MMCKFFMLQDHQKTQSRDRGDHDVLVFYASRPSTNAKHFLCSSCGSFCYSWLLLGCSWPLFKNNYFYENVHRARARARKVEIRGIMMCCFFFKKTTKLIINLQTIFYNRSFYATTTFPCSPKRKHKIIYLLKKRNS